MKPHPASSLAILLATVLLVPAQAADKIEHGEMAGYLLVPNDKVPETFNSGFSMYVAAWPLLREYPGNRFQTGLFGTWMFAQHEGAGPTNAYSDIEGGLGWWRDTQYATETPKFIMGGVAPAFVEWANGPGAGKGRDWTKPKVKYGVAQLSPWVLWPPDGLNLKQGTCGELFGYGYLPLPLAQAKTTTAGTNVPAETGLVDFRFTRPITKPLPPYVTPDEAHSSWKKPGPKAGPFETQLGDGSVVTYYWYRFADQPALLNADMTDAVREAMQARVEKLHRTWKKDRDYLPAPALGKLAELDPAVVVTPPKGLEVGYVPIVTRQAAQK